MVIIEATAATALASETLQQLQGVPLGAFLARQRWFSAKHDAASATLAEVIPLFPTCDAVLCEVDVLEKHGSATASYLVPIALTDAEVPENVVIARVKTATAELKLVDAVHDVRFRDALLKYLVDGRRFTTDGTQLRFIKHAALSLEPGIPSKVVSAEQSNTSLIYGDALIVKLFRKLTPGENPDIEIGAYLTESGSKTVPALVGSATLDGDRGPTALVMAQRLVPNARDLWGYVTSQLRSLCSEGGAEPFVDEAAALGRTTRELHEALARATDRHAFTPARANHEDIVRWCSAIRHEVSDSIAVLERTDFGQALHPEKVSPARRDRSAGSREQIIAQALQDLEHRDVVLRDINALENDESLEVGLTIRHHGDYHLGQVLRDGSGAFYIIDFEGEPTRPLAERRALHSPLRDVAGMLRSFAYAAAMATLQCSQGTNALEWDVALHRAQTWQRHVREAFMQGYLSITSSVLPTDAATMEHLVRLFEIEKTFYELRYELAHRPDWVWVPMRGITEIVRESLRRGRRATGDAQPSPA